MWKLTTVHGEVITFAKVDWQCAKRETRIERYLFETDEEWQCNVWSRYVLKLVVKVEWVEFRSQKTRGSK